MLNKIEQNLIDLKFNYEEVDGNVWLVNEDERGFENIAVMYNAPLVVFRSVVMEIPAGEAAQFALYKKLLELNVSDLVHGAYGIEDDKVVLIDTLEYDGMDADEFQASLDSFSLALTQHYPLLSVFRSK
ncbi:MAG: YbjN domain-containing protein [Treponema sp.]|jgi:hypothetical protein|nr:YbjN domain-containing protein [Treponema sp.]